MGWEYTLLNRDVCAATACATPSGGGTSSLDIISVRESNEGLTRDNLTEQLKSSGDEFWYLNFDVVSQQPRCCLAPNFLHLKKYAQDIVSGQFVIC